MRNSRGHRSVQSTLRTVYRSVTVLAGLAGVGVLVSVGFAALPPVPVPTANPITEEKRVLGKILFWDEQLSSSLVVSCATCHSPARGGGDPRDPAASRAPGFDQILNTPDDVFGSLGVINSDADNNFVRDLTFGINRQITGRAANSPINAAFSPTLFWDGRATSQFVDPESGQVVIPGGPGPGQNGALESQAVGPPTSDVEMAHAGIDWAGVTSRLERSQPLALATALPADVASALGDRPSYPELFRRAFGDTDISARRIAFAIATYQRTLISNQTPFDSFRAGVPNAMTPAQTRGFNAFSNVNVNAARCAVCHAVNNDLFTDNSFRNIGLRPPAEDLGRQVVTNDPNDRGRFKVPGLRNTGLKRTFMHNGQFQTLGQVIAFYARPPGAPVQFTDNRDPVMPTINVPPPAAADIEAFLTGALTDPRVANQLFPFDRPTLFADRPADQAVLVGGAVVGTGGVAPTIIAQAPPLIGSLDFRIGVDVPAGVVGRSATLVVSNAPPVAGQITPTMIFGPMTIAAPGNATAHWPLSRADRTPGEQMWLQWRIDDPAAVGGESRSAIAQVRFFCGSQGCPKGCAADFNGSGSAESDDIFVFLDRWFALRSEADIDGQPGITSDDIFWFLGVWFDAISNGCS